MTKYAKTRNSWVISDQTDYGNPRYDEWEDTWSPSEVWQMRMEVAITTATTFDLAPFLSTVAAETDIVKIRVRNTDATNFVLVKCRQSKVSKTFATNELGFTIAKPVTITDSGTSFLTALYAKAGDYVTVSNATETANDLTSLIQTAVAGTLTLQEDVSHTEDVADVGTPTLEIISENEIKLKAGEMCEFAAVNPAHDIVLIADTAACEVDIQIIGS